jgi:hypothetical protein
VIVQRALEDRLVRDLDRGRQAVLGEREVASSFSVASKNARIASVASELATSPL